MQKSGVMVQKQLSKSTPKIKESAVASNGIRNANEAVEKISDLLNEQTNEVILKFREKAKGENTDTLITG